MVFLNEKNIRFFKLSALILGPGNSVVTNNLRKNVRAEQLTFPEFLNKKKHNLFHLYKKSLCHFCLPDSNNRKFGKGLLENQWNILFCKTRNKCKDGKAECCCMYDAEVNIKEEDLDISLTVCLLINLFPISAVEKQDLINLRDERNIYAHAKKESLEMEENDFRCKLNHMVSAIKSNLCPHSSIDFHDKICKEIEDIEKSSSMYDMCYQMFIDWIQESHDLGSIFEKALKEFLNAIKEMQDNEKGTRKQGHFHSQTCNKVLQKKFEKKIKEYKSYSVHGGLEAKKNRPTLDKQNSYTLPPYLKVSLNQRAKELPNIESLKSDERDLLSTIIQLCITGSLEGIEEKLDDLSEDCPFVRTRDKKGYCAIHYASNRDGEDAIQIIKILINHGAKLDDRTSKGITVLHIACVNGNVALCKHCLTVDSTAEFINTEDYKGWSASLFAAFHGHISILKYLKESNNMMKMTSDKTGENILQLACLAKNMNVYRYIKDTYPVLKRDKDKEGRTILHYIARGGNTNILEDLLKGPEKHGSKTFHASEWAKKEFKKSHKINPLHISCLYGHEQMSRDLISQFPNMLHETDEDGLHAVYYAAIGGNVSVMSFLKEILNDIVHRFSISENININILQMACIYEKTEMAIFIAKTFPYLLWKKDHDGWCIHHLAAKCGNLKFLKFLIEEKQEKARHVVDPCSKDNLGRTILHIACLYGNYEICEYLVSAFPAMTRERDIDDCPACVLAARGGSVCAINLLFDKSISFINEVDKTNMSYAAKCSEKVEIIQLIEEKISRTTSKEIHLDETVASGCEVNIEMETIELTEKKHQKTRGTLESTVIN